LSNSCHEVVEAKEEAGSEMQHTLLTKLQSLQTQRRKHNLETEQPTSTQPTEFHSGRNKADMSGAQLFCRLTHTL